MASTAAFTISASPSVDPTTGDRGYEGSSGETLTLQLEDNPATDVQRTTFAVNDAAVPESPVKSEDAPVITFTGSGTATEVAATPISTVDIDLPVTTIAQSYEIRCTINTAAGTQTFTRTVSIRNSLNLRKLAPAEQNQFHSKGWSQTQNEMVDEIAGVATTGTSTKVPARIATTADIGLSGLAAIDGVTPIAGNRILVKNQAAGEENGVYVAAAGAWSRATDFDDDAEVFSGVQVYVEEGTANATKVFFLSTVNPITVGVTALVFIVSTVGSLTDVLGVGNTTGPNDISVDAGQAVTFGAAPAAAGEIRGSASFSIQGFSTGEGGGVALLNWASDILTIGHANTDNELVFGSLTRFDFNRDGTIEASIDSGGLNIQTSNTVNFQGEVGVHRQDVAVLTTPSAGITHIHGAAAAVVAAFAATTPIGGIPGIFATGGTVSGTAIALESQAGVSGAGDGGQMDLTTGNAFATGGGSGGDWQVQTGSGDGTGQGGDGSVSIGSGGATGDGGEFGAEGGASSAGGAANGQGANLTISGGQHNAGAPIGGTASLIGGSIVGTTNGTAGGVSLTTGQILSATGTKVAGNITLDVKNTNADTTGVVNFQQNGQTLLRWNPQESVLGGVNAFETVGASAVTASGRNLAFITANGVDATDEAGGTFFIVAGNAFPTSDAAGGGIQGVGGDGDLTTAGGGVSWIGGIGGATGGGGDSFIEGGAGSAEAATHGQGAQISAGGGTHGGGTPVGGTAQINAGDVSGDGNATAGSVFVNTGAIASATGTKTAGSIVLDIKNNNADTAGIIDFRRDVASVIKFDAGIGSTGPLTITHGLLVGAVTYTHEAHVGGGTAPATTFSGRDSVTATAGPATGGALILSAGAGVKNLGAVSVIGGAININGGLADGNSLAVPATGGAVLIAAGNAVDGSANTGGALTLSSGTGATADGEVTINRGATAILSTTSANTSVNAPTTTLNLQAAGTTRMAIASGAITITGPSIRWSSSTVTPSIFQITDSSSDATGQLMTINAQDVSGGGTTITGGALTVRAGNASGAATNDVGGDLNLAAGTGTTSGGTLRLQVEGATKMSITAAVMQIESVDFRFHADVAAPFIRQNTDATSDATGDLMTIHAQDVSGGGTTITGGALTVRAGNASGAATTDNGGLLTLSSGSGTTNAGPISIQTGGNTKITVTPTLVEWDVPLLRFHTDQTSPVIAQNGDAGTDATGDLMTIHAQDVTGGGTTITGGALTVRAGNASGAATNDVGGILVLAGGTGTTTDGNISFQHGGLEEASVTDGAFNVVNVLKSFGNDIQFADTSVAPFIRQFDDANDDATGDLMTIHAQDVTGGGTTITGGALTVRAGNASGAATNDVGGTLNLAAGTGTTTDGILNLQAGGSTQLFVASTVIVLLNPLVSFDSSVVNPAFEHGDEVSGTGGALLTIHAQNVTSSSGNKVGGALTQHAGDVTGTGTSNTGGATILRAGNASGGTANTGGNLTLSSGTGTDTDGDVAITAGSNNRFFTTNGGVNTSVQGSTDVSLRIGASIKLNITSTIAEIRNLSTLQFDTAVSSPILQQDTDSAGGGTGDLFTIHAQNVSGTSGTKVGAALLIHAGEAINAGTSNTGGKTTVRPGDATGGTANNGGDLALLWGVGSTLTGNITIGTDNSTWNSMEGGLFFGDMVTAPTGNPTAGIYTYVDTADGLWKYRDDSGVTHTI